MKVYVLELWKLWMLPVILILFCIVHAVKMARLYLIVIDRKIPFKRFLLLYCSTTFVNLAIPYKLGEFFRIFAFSKACKSFKIGLTSVLVDRFFDTMALVLILLPSALIFGDRVNGATLLLTVFVVVLVFIYLTFSSFYTYLNRYIIINRTSKGAMRGLKFLELLKSSYDYVKNLVVGRYAILIIFSFISWLLECGILFILAMFLGIQGGANISSYIEAIVSSARDNLMNSYIIFGCIVMGIATIVGFIILLVDKKKDKGHTNY